MSPQMTDLERDYQAAASAADWDRADALADQIETIQAQEQKRLRQPGALLAGALWYAEQGHPVFPLGAGSKIPLPRSGGFKDATTDLAQIRRWWRSCPDFNIGLSTGVAFDVIDIDGPCASALAYHNPTWWPPVHAKASTPRHGGAHWYTKATGAGNRAGMVHVPCSHTHRCGIDYRGIGGYVVAPPSRTQVGTYTWLTPISGAV